MAAFDRIKPGDVLYDYHSQYAGNTTCRVWDNWEVRVIEVDREKRTARVSWNGNPEETYCELQFKRLRRSPGKRIDPFARW